MWTTKLQKWDPLGWDWWHCKVWALHLSGGCILQYSCSVSMQQVGDNLWTVIHLCCWSEVQRPCFGCTKMHLGEVKFNWPCFQIEIFVKWSPFGPFFHLLTLLSIFKHWYSSQSNEILLKYGYKRWERGIKCTRFENIYSCNTHNNINDWLIRKNKTAEFQIWSNWMLIWVSVPVQAQYTLSFTGFLKESHHLYDPFMTKREVSVLCCCPYLANISNVFHFVLKGLDRPNLVHVAMFSLFPLLPLEIATWSKRDYWAILVHCFQKKMIDNTVDNRLNQVIIIFNTIAYITYFLCHCLRPCKFLTVGQWL
jgi:hypothetical protein